MGKKKTRGRPLTSPLARDNILSFRLNSKELECLNAYCERYDTSISDCLRDCLMIFSIIPE
jgi:hypothetical protein